MFSFLYQLSEMTFTDVEVYFYAFCTFLLTSYLMW